MLSCSAWATEPPIDKPYILFIGRLDPQKGLDILIDAYSRAKNRNPFCLLVVGPECVPQYTKYLKNQVDVLGLKKQVIFVGPVFSNKKWSLYHHAWAFCTPSRSEGLSAVHLEAASARVPVITTYNSGIDELEGAGGLLVRPQVEELAKALEQVFSWDERERNERGLTMRKLIEQHYSWNRVGPQYLNLYTKLFQEA